MNFTFSLDISVPESNTANGSIKLVRSGCDITLENVSERVRINGWLQHKRLGGQFLIVRDAYGTAQVVVQDPLVKYSYIFMFLS